MRPGKFDWRWLIVLGALGVVPLLAQDEEEPADPPPAAAAEPARAATNEQEEEDAFVPSEEISLDKSVAFPADI